MPGLVVAVPASYPAVLAHPEVLMLLVPPASAAVAEPQGTLPQHSALTAEALPILGLALQPTVGLMPGLVVVVPTSDPEAVPVRPDAWSLVELLHADPAGEAGTLGTQPVSVP